MPGPGFVRALAAAAVTATAVAAMVAPAAAQARSFSRTGDGAAPARPHVTAGPASSVQVKRACPAPVRPGYAACEALARTGLTEKGQLSPGAAPLGYGPADLQSAYALPSSTAGVGATVAVVDAYDDPTAAADLAVYRKQFGLPPCTVASGCFRKINQRGGDAYPPRDQGWAQEISLDLDMVSAACPLCHILLVEADNDRITSLGAAVNEAVAQGAKYVSNSYDASGSGTVQGDQQEVRWDARYYDHPGVVVTASAGDDGYPGGFPAVYPQVVAVGGTSLLRRPDTARGWVETAWSGTGSGCDGTLFAKPSWQTDTGCTGRTYNDVSAVADPDTGVAVYDSYGMAGWGEFGGTSVSSPLIAAVYALAGQPAGGTYPGSYPYADPSGLNDVTKGANAPAGTCTPAYLCAAGPGYDGPTGLGTPDGVAAFAAGPHGTVSGTVTDAATGAPLPGARIQVGGATAQTDASGRYSLSALDGSYTPTAAAFGYATADGAPVTVTSQGTATENFTLTERPTATVTGTVTDASGNGWPLYAEVRVPGTSVVAYTSPATGQYTITLPAGSAYRLDVSAQYPGYQAGSARIRLGTAGAHQDFGLSVDQTACTAPGYRPVYHGLRQEFGSGTRPAGWTVTNAPGTRARFAWQFGNPHHLPNYTGGSGGFAVADAMKFDGLTEPDPTTFLTTPDVDMSADTAPVLEFSQDLDSAVPPSSGVIVQLSTDGGQNWTDVYSTDQTVPGPDQVLLPLPQAAGQSQVAVRFIADDEFSSWELDDVFAGQLTCRPDGGGLVVGQVRDANTGQPVNGAAVSGAGQQAGTQPEPGDPAVGGGLYWLSAPAGSLALTASAAGYATGTAQASVTGGAVTTANLSLAAARLAVRPGRVAVSETMGATRTARVSVTNTGGVPASVAVSAQAGPSRVAGGSVVGGSSAPLLRIPGHYSTAIRVAAGRSAATTPPASGGWTAAAHYPEPLYDNTAATDPATGEVYSVGGTSAVGATTTDAFAYQPASRTWSQLPAMPYPRGSAAAAVIDGQLYVTDGYDTNDGGQQAALDIYDPHTRLWTAGAPIPHAGYGAAGAALDGKLYVVGGCPSDQVCTYRYVQVYDPATKSWSQAAAYPRKISFLGCGAINGELYCAGGYDHALQTGTTAAYAYDPATNTWAQVASLPEGLWGAATAAANGRLLVSGGIARFDQELTNQGFGYDPASNTWSALPNAPGARYRGGAACGFYTVGGLAAAGPVASADYLPGYGECDGGAGVPWLTASPAALTLAPGASATVTLTLAAGAAWITQPGRYTATLLLDDGGPYPVTTVPVTLTATPPVGWAALAGTVSGRGCDGRSAPLDGASVQVNGAAPSQTLTTGSNGRYVLWLPASDGPLSLIATASDWLAGTASAQLKPGATTTANITLKRASCG